MHRHQDVTATDKLLVNVKLRYGWPLGVFFDTFSNLSACNAPLPILQPPEMRRRLESYDQVAKPAGEP